MTAAPCVIAEIGCNHRGELETALEMIEVAAGFCRADVVKFQKRTPTDLLTPEEYRAPHPEPRHAYGASYGEHRERLELPIDDHRRLASRCRELGVEYSTSVWDRGAARDVLALDPPPRILKVPSAANLDLELLALLCGEHGGEIHLSLGMTRREEEERIVGCVDERGRLGDLVLYACTSGYPVPFEQICLGEIPRLAAAYGERVRGIGFSGHHLGIAADVAALALGARWFERHLTLDRTWRGTDHAASLEPDGLRRLARDLRHVALALGEKDEPILPVERDQRTKLKRGVDDRG